MILNCPSLTITRIHSLLQKRTRHGTCLVLLESSITVVSKLSTSLVIGLIDLALNIKIRTQNPFEHPIYTIQIIEMKVFQKALKNKYLQRRKFKWKTFVYIIEGCSGSCAYFTGSADPRHPNSYHDHAKDRKEERTKKVQENWTSNPPGLKIWNGKCHLDRNQEIWRKLGVHNV